MPVVALTAVVSVVGVHFSNMAVQVGLASRAFNEQKNCP